MKTICFCGMDGAGKSTQCSLLQKRLQEVGYKVDIVHIFTKGNTVASRAQDRPVLKYFYSALKDMSCKGAQGWIKLWIGFSFFFIDAWLTQMNYCFKYKGDFLILDRSFYDHVANFVTSFSEGFHRNGLGLCRMFPEPGVTFVIEVPPEVAHQRKPEDSVQCLTRRLNFYRRLSDRLGFSLIKGTIEQGVVSDQVLSEVKQKLIV